MTTIYLIRHAQAEGNLYRRCHSWHNGLITTKGRAQIESLAQRFEGIHIDAVYSSDLYRTMTTAGAIYRPRGLPLRIDPDLREIGTGIWEDKPWGQWLHEDRDTLLSFLRCDPNWQVPGGETYPQVRIRMTRSIARIAATHPGQTVAVVSHGCAIKTALSAWLDLPLEQIGQIPLGDNTSVAKLLAEDGRITVVYHNDNSHLGALAASPRTDSSDASAGLRHMERNALWFQPLSLPQDQALYLSAREDGWLSSHGSMDGFDGQSFLHAAEQDAAYAPESLLAALLGDEPVGILQMDFQQEAEQDVGRVPFLYIKAPFRSKGLGVQLLGHAVSIYRTMGRKLLRLRCAPENERAQRFYRAHGFYKVGEEPGGSGTLDIMEQYIGLSL